MNDRFRTAAIGDVFKRRVERGQTGLPIMSITMGGGIVERSALDRRVVSNLSAFDHLLVRQGDIAYNMMRLWQGVVGRAERDCLVSPAYVVLEPTEEIDSSFAEYLFRFPPTISKFHQYSQGVVDDRLRLYPHDLLRIPISFPPSVPTQRRIAAVLRTVDEVIEATEARIEKQQAIKQGLLHDLFTRGVTPDGQLRPRPSERPDLYRESELGVIPREWEVLKLGDMIGPIVSGWSPICDAEPATIDEWAILKTTAVVWTGYEETENKRLPNIFHPIPSIEVESNDILITRKGPRERVGVVVHVPQTREKLMIPDTVFKTRMTPRAKLLPSFVPLALGSGGVQRYWDARKVGLAEAQVNVNHPILRNTPVPTPGTEEQKMIVERNSGMHSEVSSSCQKLSKLRNLKSALMQDLLTGRVSADSIDLDSLPA